MQLDDDLVTNYFDKLIQIPLKVPPLGTQEVRAYLMLLYIDKSELSEGEKSDVRVQVCKQLSQSWQGKRMDLPFILKLLPDCSDELRRDLEMSDRLAPLLASSMHVSGNPRLIKRFLNTLWIRLAVAKSQSVSVDEAMLAKVLLFERCATETAYKELIARINQSDDGRPLFLANWETQAQNEEEIEDLPKGWDSDFVRDWLALEPALADSDLRAVVYVSRETMPIITSTAQMSHEALKLLEVLLSAKKESPFLKERLRALTGRECNLIASRLLSKARQEQSWGVPNVLNGFLMLIDAVPETSEAFLRFLKTINVEQLTPAIIPKLSDKSWAQEMLMAWQNDAQTPQKVTRAIKQQLNKG